MKYYLVIFLLLGFSATTAHALINGIQNEDFKTPADLAALGIPNSHLVNTSNIWDETNGHQLSTTMAGIGSPACITSTVSTGTTVPTLAKCNIINVNSSSGAIAIVLPDAAASIGLCADIKNIGSPVSNVTMTAFGGQTIDGNASDILTTRNSAHRYCAVGGNWFIY